MDEKEYLREIEEALGSDNTRLGEVWSRTKEGKSPNDISEELNVSTSGFVYTYLSYIRAIIEGEISRSPTMAKQIGGALRNFLKRHKENFSDYTVRTLTKRAEECDRWVSDVQALEEEDSEVERQTTSVEKTQTAGIYVYTYPHYLRNPVVPGTDGYNDRTYLKIGMSGGNVRERILRQTTGMPEPAMILQVWVVDDDNDLENSEKRIHEHLSTVGHGTGGSRRREWLLTNEDSVASTARLIGLTCHYDHRNQDSV